MSWFVTWEGRTVVDWAIPTDKLNSCWPLFERVGFPPIGHENKTEHQPYQEYYRPSLRDTVGAAYAEDVERFGFRFE